MVPADSLTDRLRGVALLGFPAERVTNHDPLRLLVDDQEFAAGADGLELDQDRRQQQRIAADRQRRTLGAELGAQGRHTFLLG